MMLVCNKDLLYCTMIVKCLSCPNTLGDPEILEMVWGFHYLLVWRNKLGILGDAPPENLKYSINFLQFPSI